MRITVAFLLTLMSLSAFADRVVIAGKPIALVPVQGYFAFPKTYTEKNMGYLFVTISNLNRVCYVAQKPELARLDVIEVLIESKGVKIPWKCYRYDSRYFEIDF